MVSEVELTEILQTIPWFQALSDEHFHKIAGITEVVALSRDEVLFKQGDQQKYLYVVVKGRVGVEIYSPIRGALRVFTAEPMDVVGWSSATPVVRQRTATARAVLDSLLIAIDASKLNQFCEQDHELGFIVMRRMANVAASRVMICRLQLVDLFANPMGDCDND
ncbi:Crp/Fnr family transcriptional regulator [bacterium]|nr:Crp/Fnr family transcriptional regulator [bacterium]MCB2179375.1 Crp/Fnr family transcriptional regulator [bacterium]